MIRAYRQRNGMYKLVGDRTSDTYSIRRKIKDLGGIFTRGLWYVPEPALSEIKAEKTFLVRREAFCHMPEEQIVVTESEASAKELRGRFCSLCDSHHNPAVKLLEILGEFQA